VAAARSARFRVAISRDQGTVVVSVHGDLDVPGARHLGSVLDDIIDGQGNMAVVVDLDDASATDPSGLSVFAAAAKRASTTATSLRVGNPPAPLYQLLVLTGLGRLIRTTRHGDGRPSPSAPFGRIAAPGGRSPHPVG
jgi:anti-sigma B factor antagonist